MSSQVLVAIRVEASPARAFAVFTREIGAWWRPNSLFRFTDGPGGRLSFEAGVGGRLSFEAGVGGRLIETAADGRVFEIGRVTVWEPGARLAFTWRQTTFTAAQLTRVEVRFEPAGTQTRVTVTHQGWDSVPADHVARHGFPNPIFLQRHGEWWQALLAAYQSAFNPCVSKS